ncbi:MAG: response regulator [Bacteroidales bacterium]|nr:response regulator [Bacteroidales bacterium]
MKREYLPFIELVKSLITLCGEGKTGTMFVVSDNHSIQLKIDKGDIVGATFGKLHGLEVLDVIKQLKKVKFSFSEGLLLPQREPRFFDLPEIKTNYDIFNRLGLKFSDITKKTAQKVLIIDDSKIARRVAKEALLEHGFEVIEAPDGLQGLSKLVHDKPALILLDIIMPTMDGYQVLSLIRANHKFKDVPVIMLTSRDKLFDKIKGKMSDADEYLTKPFVVQELVDMVEKHLS